MILHRATLQEKPTNPHRSLVTPGESRYGKNILELIHYSKFEENTNPMYVRAVTLRLVNNCNKVGIANYVKTMYTMMLGENYHQLLIVFPPSFDVKEILELLVEEKIEDSHFIAWSARSFKEAFAVFRKKFILEDSQ